MINQPNRKSRTLCLTVLALSGLTLSLSACEKKKKPAPPPPPPPPPAEVIPDPVDINAVMSQLRPDARVQFPERNAPADQSLAEAVVLFASDFAKGDERGLATRLAPDSRAILQTLVSDGTWAEETGKIEQVRIVQLSPLQEDEASFSTVVMAIQAPGGAYPLAWEGRRQGSNWVFKSIPTESVERRRASEFDSVSVRVGASAMMQMEPELPEIPEGEESHTPGGHSSNPGSGSPSAPSHSPPPSSPAPSTPSSPRGPRNISPGGS